MNTEAFLQTHSDGLLPYNLTGIDASFFPDGSLLALAMRLGGSVAGEKQEAWMGRPEHAAAPGRESH